MGDHHAPGSSMASTVPKSSRGADRAGARSSPSYRTMRWWWASPPVRVSAAAGGRAAEPAPGPLHSPHHRPPRSQHDSPSPTEDATLDGRWCHLRRSSTVGVNSPHDAALSPSASSHHSHRPLRPSGPAVSDPAIWDGEVGWVVDLPSTRGGSAASAVRVGRVMAAIMGPARRGARPRPRASDQHAA